MFIFGMFSKNVYSFTNSGFISSQSLFKNTRAKKYYSKITMEDFGFLKNTGIGFDDLWKDNPIISERALEKELNKEGIRFRMNRTDKECEEIRSLWRDIKIGPITLKGPRVLTIWEAFGFTATSNNEARQKCKLEAQANASEDPRGLRAKHLGKYGYPRLVGTNGIASLYSSYLWEKINAPNYEHFYEDHPEYGSIMPMGLDFLTNGELEFIRQWIIAGAPENGHVADESLLMDTTIFALPDFDFSTSFKTLSSI